MIVDHTEPLLRASPGTFRATTNPPPRMPGPGPADHDVICCVCVPIFTPISVVSLIMNYDGIGGQMSRSAALNRTAASASRGAAGAGLQAKLRLLLAAPGGKAVHRAARPWRLRQRFDIAALLKTLVLPTLALLHALRGIFAAASALVCSCGFAIVCMRLVPAAKGRSIGLRTRGAAQHAVAPAAARTR